MTLYEKLINRGTKLSVISLGYVGMPIAVAYARKVQVVGFDLDIEKIRLHKEGIDPTHK